MILKENDVKALFETFISTLHVSSPSPQAINTVLRREKKEYMQWIKTEEDLKQAIGEILARDDIMQYAAFKLPAFHQINIQYYAPGNRIHAYTKSYLETLESKVSEMSRLSFVENDLSTHTHLFTQEDIDLNIDFKRSMAIKVFNYMQVKSKNNEILTVETKAEKEKEMLLLTIM